jgi:adenylate cyclase
MKKQKIFDLSIPILVVAGLVALSFTVFYERLEGSTYNMLLRVKPKIEEHEALLLVDFDDAAIELAGTWPVSRSIFADGLILMRELGAEYIVFDIEYVDTSPRGINSKYLEEQIPEQFGHEFGAIKDNMSSLTYAVAEGQIQAKDMADFLPDLVSDIDTRMEGLLDEMANIVRDNDEYLGKAAAVFDKAFFTLNIIPDEKPIADEVLKDYIFDHIRYANVQGTLPADLERFGMVPTILPILSRGAGAGFPNVIIDDDGVRRRIHLLYEYENGYFPQLSFRPLLDWLGNPDITVSSTKIVLENARYPGSEEPESITIPLTADHTMLINWPASSYVESFRHISFGQLILHDEIFDLLIKNLRLRQDWGYLNAYSGSTPLLDVYAYYEQLRADMLETENPESILEFRSVRDYLLAELEVFLNGPAETEIASSLAEYLRAEYMSKEDYDFISADLPEWFEATRIVLADLNEMREELIASLDGSFCITGHVGTSTTDIGVNPFEGEYMNVGTHASVANTILQQDFLDEVSPIYSIIMAIVLCFLLMLIISPMQPLAAVLTGVGFLLFGATAQVLVFIFTGLYTVLIIPSAAIFLTFVIATVLKFVRAERDKSFLRDAFSHYLSTDVIREIISDPDKLKLGGEERDLTAIFTDIRGFSSISEKMGPSELVKLLNIYLGEMSDIILDENGTIDKFEGDAIVCFFGAPNDMSDHADRACRSATRMRRMETELNERFITEGLSPDHLVTRIGINSGAMVVGNMGTTKKMDYTIMGNSVNLAARLEGVNKFYGTWTIMSEYTRDQLPENQYILRILDRVRVVGIKTPVRLFELINDRGHATKETVEAVELFAEGIRIFEEREWEQASNRFNEVLKLIPKDAPAKQYIGRCKKFASEPPGEKWDGVFNYDTK